MIPIQASCNKGIMTLKLQGRIDSTNAEETKASIDAVLDGKSYENLVLDLQDLSYISSAGLRIVLTLCKKNRGMQLINVNSEIYEVFEMTGFTEMMKIKKAYKNLSVEGCEVIGTGANGKVYRIDSETIVKLYLNPDSLPDIARERELARRAFVLGVPTAISYDIVRIGESYGTVFELLNADSLAKIIAKTPEKLDECVKIFVDLLKTIHATLVRPEDMPDMKAVALDWVNFLKPYLPEDKWQRLWNLTEAVPENHHMIHGDYHTKNVMMQNGEALLIDMDTLSQGDPVFEFASIYNAFIGFNLLEDEESVCFQGYPVKYCRIFWKKLLELYFDTTDAAFLQGVEDKSALLGYVRLMRRGLRRNFEQTEEGRQLLTCYKQKIIELVDKVDELKLAKE